MSSINQENQVELTPAHGVEQLITASNEPIEQQAHDWQDEKTILLPTVSGGRNTIWLEMVSSGQHFNISRFPVTLGRHPDCDIVLAEDGVSRQHASILKVDGGYAIEDSGSLNGIRINEYNVDRVLLGDGDRISIGSAELVFHYVVAQKNGDLPRDKKRKNIIRFAAVAALIAVIGIYAYRFDYLPSLYKLPLIASVLNTDRQTEIETVDTDTTNHLASETVVDNEPASFSVATLNGSNVVIPTSEKLAEEKQQIDVGAIVTEEINSNLEVSIQKDPDTDSVSAADEIIEFNNPLNQASQKNDTTVAQTAATVTTSSQNQVADSPLIFPSALEIKTPKKKTKPSLLNADRSRALIEQARKDYLAGDAENAFADLQAIEDSNRHRAAQRDEAAQIRQQLSESYDFYLAGQRAFGENKKEQAFKEWQHFFESENALILQGKSIYADRVSDIVFNEYRTTAEAAAKNGQHHESYRYWQRAAAIRPDSEASIALASLNQKAQTLYRDGYRKETVNLSQARLRWKEVMDLVPPDTEYHTKARAKLRWYAYLDQ